MSTETTNTKTERGTLKKSVKPKSRKKTVDRRSDPLNAEKVKENVTKASASGTGESLADNENIAKAVEEFDQATVDGNKRDVRKAEANLNKTVSQEKGESDLKQGLRDQVNSIPVNTGTSKEQLKQEVNSTAKPTKLEDKSEDVSAEQNVQPETNEETNNEQLYVDAANMYGLDIDGDEEPSSEDAVRAGRDAFADLEKIANIERDKDGKITAISFPDLKSSPKGIISKVLTALSIAGAVLTGGAIPPINVSKLTGADKDRELQETAYTNWLNDYAKPVLNELGIETSETFKSRKDVQETAQEAGKTDVAREGYKEKSNVDLEGYKEKSDIDLKADIERVHANLGAELAKMDDAQKHEFEMETKRFKQDIEKIKLNDKLGTNSQKEIALYLSNLDATKFPRAMVALEENGYTLSDMLDYARANAGTSWADKLKEWIQAGASVAK